MLPLRKEDFQALFLMHNQQRFVGVCTRVISLAACWMATEYSVLSP